MSNLWQCKHLLLSGRSAKQLVIQGTSWNPSLFVRPLCVSMPVGTPVRSTCTVPSRPRLLSIARSPAVTLLPVCTRAVTAAPVCTLSRAVTAAPLWTRRLHSSPPRPEPRPEQRPEPRPEQEPERPAQQLNQRQRLRLAVRDYGTTVIVFHVTISLASLGFFYVAVKSGLDVVAILRWAGLGDSLAQSKYVTGGSTFVLAYAVHKVFAPARIATTLGCTPFIVRYLRRRGLLRTPGPRVD